MKRARVAVVWVAVVCGAPPATFAVVPPTLHLLLLLGAGFVAGTLNVVAGGGSFLTLPALIFLGLPPTAANASNRVAVLLQNVGAVWTFDRGGHLDRRALVAAAIPSTLGAAVGTALALVISGELFQRLLAVLMVVVSLWSLWSARPGAAAAPRAPAMAGTPAAGTTRRALLAAAWFVVGVYGGFVQAGVGFLILAVTSAAGFDLVRGNALKVAATLCFTVLSLALFAAQGEVRWLPGLVLGVGSLLGGFAGAHLAVRKGDRWIRGVVTATILVFAVKLWWDA